MGNRGQRPVAWCSATWATSSATGVAFTRNPGNGENYFYGEYLVNAQGEDVVAGIRTPAPINEKSTNDQSRHLPTLESLMPELYNELDGYPEPARKTLQGHAGHRVHHRRRRAVHAAMPRRKTQRRCRGPHGHRYVQGKTDRRQYRDHAGRPDPARRAASAHDRS